MLLQEVIDVLELWAPVSSQESYDNSGLIIGNNQNKVNSVLICLDCTEKVVDEAINKNINFIISHHPIIFKGLKKLNSTSYVERVVEKCIKNEIALYSIHTNLDNSFYGVNHEIASRLSLTNCSILKPKYNVLSKLIVYVPKDNIEVLDKAMFDAGAGSVGDYDQCHFRSEGFGTFRPNKNAVPFIGEYNTRSQVNEFKVEYLVSNHLLNNVLRAMNNAHPYEEVAHDIVPIKNTNNYEGSGMIGSLENTVDEVEFIEKVKEKFNCSMIRHTQLLNKKIKNVAVCGGSGIFLLSDAIKKKADVFITSDVKYHDFFDVENKILLLDIGHYESEQYTMNLISEHLIKKFTNFAVHLTDINTNPINYR